MGLLGAFARFVSIGFVWEVSGAEISQNLCANSLKGVRRNLGAIGTHVGDEGDLTLFAHFNALIKALCGAHGPAGGVPHAQGCLLLESGSGEWWRRAAGFFLFFQRFNNPIFARKAFDYLIHQGTVVGGELCALPTDHFRNE